MKRRKVEREFAKGRSEFQTEKARKIRYERGLNLKNINWISNRIKIFDYCLEGTLKRASNFKRRCCPRVDQKLNAPTPDVFSGITFERDGIPRVALEGATRETGAFRISNYPIAKTDFAGAGGRKGKHFSWRKISSLFVGIYADEWVKTSFVRWSFGGCQRNRGK